MMLEPFEVDEDTIAIDGGWPQSRWSVSSLSCPGNTNMSRVTCVGQAVVFALRMFSATDQSILYHDGCK